MQQGFFGVFSHIFTKNLRSVVMGVIDLTIDVLLQMLHNIHGQHWLCIVSEK